LAPVRWRSRIDVVRYRDRPDAGRQLAEALVDRAIPEPVVLGLPRGGVPVAAEVAARLAAPLDVLVARKVGAPGHTEYGIGAIAEGGPVVADEVALRALRLDDAAFAHLVDAERAELHRRVERYRAGRPMVDVTERHVVLVDDGLATGVTAEAALLALRGHQPASITLAAPVCASATAERLGAIADAVVCVQCPDDFYAVGVWYDRFDQTTDAEVVALLDAAARRSG
jgi:predicted phosphoribosyltransferase